MGKLVSQLSIKLSNQRDGTCNLSETVLYVWKGFRATSNWPWPLHSFIRRTRPRSDELEKCSLFYYDVRVEELMSPVSTRRPIILSRKHGVTEKFTGHYHGKMKMNQNLDTTIRAIQTKFWITNLRRLLRRLMTNSHETPESANYSNTNWSFARGQTSGQRMAT